MYAAAFCRREGIKVSHDAGGTYPGIERLVPYVDWLIPSEEFAMKMTGHADGRTCRAKAVRDVSSRAAGATQGVRGGLLLDGGGMRRYESYPVDVQDSNGCGDTFHGAFIAAKNQGHEQ